MRLVGGTIISRWLPFLVPISVLIGTTVYASSMRLVGALLFSLWRCLRRLVALARTRLMRRRGLTLPRCACERKVGEALFLSLGLLFSVTVLLAVLAIFPFVISGDTYYVFLSTVN